MHISAISVVIAALSSSSMAVILFTLSLALFLAALVVFFLARRTAALRQAQEVQPAQAEGTRRDGDKLDRLLCNSSRARSTLMKLATYQDAEALRSVAVRETGQMMGAVAVYLYRHGTDGTIPLLETWFASDAYDRLSDEAALESESPDYLDSHAFICYRRNQERDNNPKWDALLGKAGANLVFAGPIRVEGEVWGHVSYLLNYDGEPTHESLEQFHDACAMVQIGVVRAHVLENREEHQRQLAAAARAAHRNARAKTVFLATMSHEIRTPLNAIVGFSDFLNDPAITKEETKEYTAGISQSANALLALVDDVLDLAKLETGKVDMSGHCDLTTLFRELVNVFRYRAKTKAITIESHISPDFPRLRLSEEHLRQILLNLVGNAVKFTDNGSVEWTAECHPDGNGTVALHLTVKDTGCGIPPEKLSTVFDPFEEDGSVRGRRTEGASGLGLPIVKRLLDSCNGTISIESAVGKGTEIYVRIGGVAVDSGEADAPEAIAAFRIPADFSVLVVDDVAVNLKVLALRLKKMGVANIIPANSGEEALRLLEKSRPSVVLTDMWMPGMSGADLAAAMRKGKNSFNVPVIAVTADNDASASFDMSNFSGLITKPVSVEKLRGCLMRAVRKGIAV